MKFSEFELRPELLKAIEEVGFTDCTPIQEAALGHILKGKDVSGLAQTGTGKTAAFVIPLIERLVRFKAGETGERVPSHWKRNSYVLVLVPTRELATQVQECVEQFGRHAGVTSAVVMGGASYDEQLKALRGGVDFVVGTPGRLIDLYKSHDVNLNDVGAVVFDEADRMFDMGFRLDMKFILKRIPRQRQFLLFSATLNFEVLNTAYEFGAEPMEFNVSRDQATAEGIDHEILHVGQDDKPRFLLSLFKKYSPQQCIVFTNYKFNVSRIVKFLKDNQIEATGMSSLLSQAQRNKVLEAFKNGNKQILVATDVAARGLDIQGIDLVVNYDMPEEAQGYVHRIGRTGRAGRQGRAIGLVSDRDVDSLMRVEAYLKEKVKIGWIDDSELITEFMPYQDRDPQEARMKKRFEQSREHSKPRFGHKRPDRGPRSRRRPPERERAASSSAHSSAPAASSHTPQPSARAAHGQTATPRGRAFNNEHRDRRMGRHEGRAGDRPENGHDRLKRRPLKQGRHRGDRHGGGKHRSFNPAAHHPPRATAASANANATKQSIGEKVKGFFSKIFGKD